MPVYILYYFLGGRESAWDSRLGMREFEHPGRVNVKIEFLIQAGKLKQCGTSRPAH